MDYGGGLALPFVLQNTLERLPEAMPVAPCTGRFRFRQELIHAVTALHIQFAKADGIGISLKHLAARPVAAGAHFPGERRNIAGGHLAPSAELEEFEGTSKFLNTLAVADDKLLDASPAAPLRKAWPS